MAKNLRMFAHLMITTLHAKRYWSGSISTAGCSQGCFPNSLTFLRSYGMTHQSWHFLSIASLRNLWIPQLQGLGEAICKVISKNLRGKVSFRHFDAFITLWACFFWIGLASYEISQYLSKWTSNYLQTVTNNRKSILYLNKVRGGFCLVVCPLPIHS